MSYVNTGWARRKTLTVTKGAYTKSYAITSGFIYAGTVYQSITNDAFAKMTDSEYDTRLMAFISYVYSKENGLQSDCPDMTMGSVVYNTSLCPLPLSPQP
ncbi:hypothetical protein [Bacteroides heparinolyticus]|uniref:hypothetical protein n=1 Tax=Prevotella heparinolytica TaxID=28113 RepID=UPI00359F61CE